MKINANQLTKLKAFMVKIVIATLIFLVILFSLTIELKGVDGVKIADYKLTRVVCTHGKGGGCSFSALVNDKAIRGASDFTCEYSQKKVLLKSTGFFSRKTRYYLQCDE